jgi:hypothetical protein
VFSYAAEAVPCAGAKAQIIALLHRSAEALRHPKTTAPLKNDCEPKTNARPKLLRDLKTDRATPKNDCAI